MECFGNGNDEDSDLETTQSIESFNNWGKIISEVKESLPTIHSDSEESSASDDDDDVEVKTFHRSSHLKISQNINKLTREKKQTELRSSSFLLFERLNCKHRKHQFHEPYQGDLFELPIYGESSKQEKSCTSRLDPAVVKSSNEKLSKPSKSSDTKYSYSLKGLDKFSLDDVSDTLVLEDKQLFERSVQPLETSFKQDKDTNCEKILEELTHLSQLERKSLKEKTKSAASIGVSANLPIHSQFLSSPEPSMSLHKDSNEPETLLIDLRPSQASEQNAEGSPPSDEYPKRRSMHNATSESTGSEESDDDDKTWRAIRDSYKKSQRVKESKKDNQTALQLPETSLTDAIEEETKRASKALILQKVKNMKVKKLLTKEKEIYPKIEIIGSPPISNNTESDGIYASQRLKNPAPEVLCNGDAGGKHPVQAKNKSKPPGKAKSDTNIAKTENNHTAQNLKNTTKQDQAKVVQSSKSNEFDGNNNGGERCTATSIPSSVGGEVKQKLFCHLEEQFLNRFTNQEAKTFPLLYDSELSYEPEPKTLPSSIDMHPKSDVLLLSFKMSPVGCVLLNRAQGNRRFVPADSTSGFSITYALLISWILALIPNKLKNPFAFNSDAFRIEQENEEELPKLGDSEGTFRSSSQAATCLPYTVEGDVVEVPFNVASFHQAWHEDSQTVVVNVIIVPNDCYNPNRNNRRKKPKKDYAFYEAVKHFLQSNRIQEACPWHSRPESPLFFNHHEMNLSCARKPMFTYVTLSNDYQIIQQVLRTRADFMWKTGKPMNSFNSADLTNELQTTSCLLQREALSYPISTFDLLLRLQSSCLDVASIRLVYLSRLQLNKAILTSAKSDNLSEELPCVVLAVRGKNAIKKLSKIIGPRDPILAGMTDRGSLNALYGEQISKHRGDVTVPTDVANPLLSSTNWGSGRKAILYGRFVQIIDKFLLPCDWGINMDPSNQLKISAPLLFPPEWSAEMNVFYSPRSEERARLQLQKWFGGRFSLEEQTNHNMAPKNRREPIHDVFNTETHPRCPFLVSGSPSQICLIVSPRFRSRYLGDLLLITQDQGFTVEGFKQMMLHDKASSLFIPPQFARHFQTILNFNMTVNEEYYDVDDWWRRPAMVILLSRENAISHRAGLLAAIQTELLYRTESECSLMDLTNQYFHVVAYTDAVSHVLGPMCQVLNYKLDSIKYCQFLAPDPELEQVVVLSVLGRNAVAELARTLQSLFDAACDNALEPYIPLDGRDYVFCEEYRGFELMGIKHVPSLSLNQAKELITCEVGTVHWFEKLKHCVGKPAFVCVLRRVNACMVLRDLLHNTSKKDAKNKVLSHDSVQKLVSLTAEMAYRQIQTFFSAKELFSDNQSRFLLKFLPPSARDSYYYVTSTNVEENEEKMKNKKKKTDKLRNHYDSTYVDHLASLLSPFYFLSSILIIKPDAFPRHFVKILKRLHRENFKVVAAKLAVIAEDQALQIAPEKYLKMPGEQRVFVSHVTSGPSMVLCVQRSNGVRKLLELAGPLNPRSNGSGDICRIGAYTLREEFGIDEFSNAVHVSESYSAACEEMKLFFPDGLCCNETAELKAERIPTPGVDRIICKDKMKGREVKICLAENGLLGLSGMEIQPLCVILSHTLVQGKHNTQVPPYIDLIEQLTTQGYELCALRMSRLQVEQVQTAYKLIGGRNSCSTATIEQLSAGPSLLMVLQRENGLLLFDSIIERFFKLYPKVERDKDLLRSQTLAQTHEISRYFFSRIDVRHSVLQIAHTRVR